MQFFGCGIILRSSYKRRIKMSDSTERQMNINTAKMAEQSERYEDMAMVN